MIGTHRLVFDPDTGRLLTFLRRDTGLNIYGIGDLDPFFAPYTTWFGWSEGNDQDELTAAAMLYTPDRSAIPTLLALSRRPAPMRHLLTAVAGDLPPLMYAHVSPGVKDVLDNSYTSDSEEHHAKMLLPDDAALPAADSGGAGRIERIGTRNLPEVEELYRESYPDNWFDPRMIETARYVGLRVQETLVAIAGVHVYSPRYGVAALGNITTHPDYRGLGYGRRVTAELCRRLRADGLSIGLNVHSSNLAAVNAYRAVGFVHAADYIELTLRARD